MVEVVNHFKSAETFNLRSDRLLRFAFLFIAVTAFAVTTSRLPAGIQFEPNRGQATGDVRYLARTSRSTLFLSDAGASLHLRGPRGTEQLTLRLLGANPRVKLEGGDKLEGVSNYLIGNRPDQWRTGIANYAKVRYREVYPGADLVFYGNGSELEYDLVLKPGANPALIRLRTSRWRDLRFR